MIVEVYKGFSIHEAFGDHASAGYKFQIDLSPIQVGHFFGVYTLEKARNEIDFMAEMFPVNSKNSPGV